MTSPLLGLLFDSCFCDSALWLFIKCDRNVTVKLLWFQFVTRMTHFFPLNKLLRIKQHTCTSSDHNCSPLKCSLTLSLSLSVAYVLIYCNRSDSGVYLQLWLCFDWTDHLGLSRRVGGRQAALNHVPRWKPQAVKTETWRRGGPPEFPNEKTIRSFL